MPKTNQSKNPKQPQSPTIKQNRISTGVEFIWPNMDVCIGASEPKLIFW